MKKLYFKSQVKLTRAIAFLACLFFLAGVANASIIYDNLASQSIGFDPLNIWGPIFNSFSTGATDTTLLDVQLRLFRQSSASSSGLFSVALFSDSNKSPGTLMYTIGALNDTQVPSSITGSDVDFPLALPQPLSAYTRYWVELLSTSDTASTTGWCWSNDTQALGVNGEYFANTFNGEFSVFQNGTGDFGSYQMEVVTPLPSAVWLLGSGLACLGLWRGRKRFKA